MRGVLTAFAQRIMTASPPSLPAPPYSPPPPTAPPSPPRMPHYPTCTDYCLVDGDCEDGEKLIRINGLPQTAYCIYVGWRGIDTQLVTDGTSTNHFDDKNSCPAGTNIWFPRT